MPSCATAGRRDAKLTNALFVCGRARQRSPTAAAIFADWPQVETDCAGLNPDADAPLSADHIDWADVIFVMDARQRTKVRAHFRALLKDKPVVCLDIPDRYEFMQPELVALLESKASPLLR